MPDKLRFDTDMMSIKELIDLKRIKYSRIGTVYSSFMEEDVFFNNKGFFHTTHDGRGRIRSESDQRMRLNLLSYIESVVRNSKSFSAPPRVIPKNDPNNREKKEIVFYELSHRFKHKTILVVLRRIGNGQLHYYSVRYQGRAKKTR